LHTLQNVELGLQGTVIDQFGLNQGSKVEQGRDTILLFKLPLEVFPVMLGNGGGFGGGGRQSLEFDTKV